MGYRLKIFEFNAMPLVVSSVCILITGTAYGFGIYLLPMVLPEMAGALQLDYTSIGIITGFSQTSSLLFIPLAGFLTHQIGGLRLIIIIQLLGSILLIGLSFVQGFYDFLILSFLIRAWSVMIWIPLASIAVEYVPYRWRGTMLIGASSATGFFIFIDGLISSFFLEHFHWRTMWWFVSAICLSITLLGWIGLKSVGAWKVAIGRQKGKKQQSYRELIDWLKSRSGIILNLIFVLIGFSFMTFQVYLASYLREELNVELDTIVLMWSVMGISGLFGGLFFGLVTDSIGVKCSLFLIFGFGIIGDFLICFSVSSLYIVLMAVLFGVSQAVVYGMGPTYISKVLSPESAGNAFTIGTMLISIGAFLGNYIGGWSNGILNTFWWLYLVIGVLFAIGALLSLSLVSESKQQVDRVL